MYLKTKTVKGNFVPKLGKIWFYRKEHQSPLAAERAELDLKAKYFVDIRIAGA